VAAGEHHDALPEVIDLLRLVQHHREEHREAEFALARLTPREQEVLALLAQGLSDREMARRLIVGVDTIHTHMTGILTKLGVESRLQALVFAARHGAVRI
jgi:DNA-binding NarL/FixJ family response regulator